MGTVGTVRDKRVGMRWLLGEETSLTNVGGAVIHDPSPVIRARMSFGAGRVSYPPEIP